MGVACLMWCSQASRDVENPHEATLHRTNSYGNGHEADIKPAHSALHAIEVHVASMLQRHASTPIEVTSSASPAQPGTTAMTEDEMKKLIHVFSARAMVNNSFRDWDRKREGTRDNPMWKYLATPCMQERYNVAADRLGKADCRRVLEVGGYISPIVDNAHFERGELYVNVDPSTSHVEGKVEGSFARLSVPLTLQDFVATLSSNKNTTGLSSIHEPFDCALILGAWGVHFGTEEDKQAFATAVKRAKMVIIESPECVGFSGIRFGGDILAKEGFTSTEKKTIDCNGDKESVALSQPPNQKGSHLLRHLEVFTQPV